MAKKCKSCNFQHNPDNAHYCGKCGKQLEYTENYKLYNAFLQTPVYNSTLNDYKKYERQVNSSWLFNTWDKITYWWSRIKSWWKYDGSDILTAIFFIFGLPVIIFLILLFWPRSCSSDKTNSCSSDNKITRIEINGKYGIGYNEDKMLVPAIYDSISAKSDGNQWVLYDRSTSDLGIAYVTDSVTNVVAPQMLKAKGIKRLSNGITIARIDGKDTYGDGNYLIVSQGCLNNTNEYKRYKFPNYLENNCIVATLSNGEMQMLGNDGMPIDGKTYFNIVIDPVGMIRAIQHTTNVSKYKNSNITTIHDYTGRQTSEKEFAGVGPFSDGVAWANVTAENYKKNVHSLIDKNGNVLFTKPNSGRAIGFGDGVGWYASSYYTKNFTAVDKTGKDLFKIQAQSVYPFTMGLGPVYKGTSYSNQKLGFVDKTGKTVIPFIYKSKYSNPHFGPDSLMVGISLNGVEGKLHRNGTFIPN